MFVTVVTGSKLDGIQCVLLVGKHENLLPTKNGTIIEWAFQAVIGSEVLGRAEISYGVGLWNKKWQQHNTHRNAY